jgi:hypothetical protein
MLETMERIFWLLLGYIVNHIFILLRRQRSNIVYFIQSISHFNINLPASGVNPARTIPLYTHTLFIRNNGNRTANNIEITHPVYLPNHITINPQDINTTIDRANRIIRFPILRPNEVVTISYLDDFPYTLESIFATRVRSNEGFGIFQPVMLYPMPPRWALRLTYLLMFLGVLFILLTVYKFLPYIGNAVRNFIRIITKT